MNMVILTHLRIMTTWHLRNTCKLHEELDLKQLQFKNSVSMQCFSFGLLLEFDFYGMTDGTVLS